MLPPIANLLSTPKPQVLKYIFTMHSERNAKVKKNQTSSNFLSGKITAHPSVGRALIKIFVVELVRNSGNADCLSIYKYICTGIIISQCGISVARVMG